MPKLNTTVKSVRIDNDKLELLEKRLGGRSINSWLNEQIVEYLTGKPQKSEKNLFPEGPVKEIESMANYFGVGVEELFDAIFTGLEEGYLSMENGKVIGVPEIDLEEFKEVCNGKDPQKVLDEVTRKIRSGMK